MDFSGSLLFFILLCWGACGENVVGNGRRLYNNQLMTPSEVAKMYRQLIELAPNATDSKVGYKKNRMENIPVSPSEVGAIGPVRSMLRYMENSGQHAKIYRTNFLLTFPYDGTIDT